MGCLESKEEKVEQPEVFSWDRDDRPDPKDFTIENQNGVTCGRKPGTVNGQQFIIDRCTDCSIYIFDHSATITIDNCENCRIFLGPVKGSVFIRNSKNLQCAIACQQFRTRDCRKVETFLLCATQPIIESSANMRFGCFQFCYPELAEQFLNAGLSIYNNTWYSVHDFTPIQDGNNWSILPDTVSIESHIPKPSTDDELGNVDISFNAGDSAVPLTRGTKRVRRFDESCLMVFFADTKGQCRTFLSRLRGTYEADLTQAKEIKMAREDAARVFSIEKFNELVEKGPLVGLELNGDDIIKNCEQVLSEMGINIQSLFVSSNKGVAKRDIDAFYNFVDMSMS